MCVSFISCSLRSSLFKKHLIQCPFSYCWYCVWYFIYFLRIELNIRTQIYNQWWLFKIIMWLKERLWMTKQPWLLHLAIIVWIFSSGVEFVFRVWYVNMFVVIAGNKWMLSVHLGYFSLDLNSLLVLAGDVTRGMKAPL